jgi:hypothetical protein|tara:strand:+ start:578 stop:697 length:120 start_codon:yes stop_codon:yes gene_type:complete
MTKGQKFRDEVKRIMIDHYDQDSFRNVVNLIYRSIYEKK